MNTWLLKLTGLRVEDAGRITDAQLSLAGGLGWWGFLAAGFALGALVFHVYREPAADLPRSRRWLLASLRLAVLLLLLGVLLRPLLSFTVEGTIRRTLVVLLDASASMNIRDPRVTEADLKRAALARGLIPANQGLNVAADRARLRPGEPVARVELVKSVLRSPQLNLLPQLQKDYDLAVFSFGQELKGLSPAGTNNAPATNQAAAEAAGKWIDQLSAQAPRTALGDAIREALNRKRGQPLAGLVIASDGANNSGSQPREMATLARQEGVPLFCYGVGITSPRDIVVANLFAPEVVFARDEVPVTVRVRSQGLLGQSAKLQLKLGGTVVEEKEIQFGADGESVIALKFPPPVKGNFDLQASIAPRADETMPDNNQQTQHLRVIDDKIKVLLVEQYPRWEYHYLQALLLRDRRVDLKCLLLDGSPNLARGDKQPFLEKFPERREDLNRFDLIILGDVDARNLTPGQLDNLGDFVARFGGAIIMVAGKRFNPWSYRKTVLEHLLPVEFDSLPVDAAGEVTAERPTRLELTASGRASAMMKLAETDSESLTRWKNLPPVYWVARVARAKPAAEVLLIDPDPGKESRSGKMPVIAFQQYGGGQVMFIGTDNLWRWRRNVGDSYHARLWGQMVQRLAMPKLLGGSKRTQLSTDRQNYLTGERITVYGRLYSAGFEPVTDPTVQAFFSTRAATPATGGKEIEVQLRAVPEQPGVYRGEFAAPAAGPYQFHVGYDRDTQLDFNVAAPLFEAGETAMNETLLRELSNASGGAFLREEDLFRLPQLIGQKAERVRSTLEVEIWSSPLYFLILLSLLTTEWLLRKRSHLK